MARTETVTVHVPVYVKPPKALTDPVAVPVLGPNPTNGDLAAYILSLQAVIRQYEGKLAAIRAIKP